MVRKFAISLAVSALLAGSAVLAAAPAWAQEKITIGWPGVPPIYADVIGYVAQETGLFKKYGVEVDLRQMDSGAAAAKAVVSGAIDASMSPSQFVLALASNAKIPVKAIFGLPNPDWLIGSMDESKANCDGIKGEAVGVDSTGGARWIQLNTYLVRKCKLVTDKDVSTVPLGANTATAMASGQIQFGVLHLDDVVVIEKETGKKVHIVTRLEEVSPGLHYLLMTVREDTLAKKRDALVRAVAALSDAASYMADPANADKVAEIATVTKHSKENAAAALKLFLDIGFWPIDDSGLPKERIDRSIANQKRVGELSKGRSGIKPDVTPVTFEQIVDLSVWEDAKKLRK